MPSCGPAEGPAAEPRPSQVVENLDLISPNLP